MTDWNSNLALLLGPGELASHKDVMGHVAVMFPENNDDENALGAALLMAVKILTADGGAALEAEVIREANLILVANGWGVINDG